LLAAQVAPLQIAAVYVGDLQLATRRGLPFWPPRRLRGCRRSTNRLPRCWT
jgi:hypothetical protein